MARSKTAACVQTRPQAEASCHLFSWASGSVRGAEGAQPAGGPAEPQDAAAERGFQADELHSFI